MIKKALNIYFFLLLTVALTSCKTITQPDKATPQSKSITLSVLNYNKLIETKQLINTSNYSILYKKLLETADSALKQTVSSVMDKTQIPPSGDKHDYISIGPYWWPDPTKPDGLPWIRKDGEINPLTREESTDYETKNKMFHNINNLALAYFFSDKIVYGNKALQLIKVWFLDKKTRMHPNLNFAQGIPGKNKGRGIGIIEFAGITNIISAIEILEINNNIDTKASQDLRLWFTAYLNWLQTSDHGIFEKNTKNNHGVYYDVQVVSILLFLNKKEEAKQILELVKTERIAKQIEANGAQPHELERTKALSYSTMNLSGFTQLAFLGKKVNVDLWSYEAKNGASIIKAYEFLKPYAQGLKTWDYKQIHSLDSAQEKLRDLFARAGSQFNVPEYCQIGVSKTNKVNSLLYNCL